MVIVYIALLALYLAAVVLISLVLNSEPKFFSLKRKAQLKVQSSDISFFRT